MVWFVPALTVVAAYLVYKVVSIVRADCDLTLLGKRLKAGYFSGKVVWVTGASSNSLRFDSLYISLRGVYSDKKEWDLGVLYCIVHELIFL